MKKPQPPFSVKFCERHETSARELIRGRDFYLDEWSLVEFFRATPSARLVDLLRICPACIFRRVSMFAGGIDEPQGTYKFDVFGPAKRVPQKGLRYLKAFLMQVVQFGALEARGVPPRRIMRHLVGTEVVRRGEPVEPFIELLLECRHEWLELAAAGMQRDWSWTKLLGPTQPAQYQGVSHASA